MPDNKTMPFLDHLAELRKRLFYCLLALIVGFAICYSFSQEIFDFLSQPLKNVLPSDGSLMMFRLQEGFLTNLKVSLIGGFFLALPFIFYHIWAFVSPGLHPHEKKYTLPFAILATILFIIGATFGFEIVFPLGFKFFLTYATGGIIPQISMGEYLSFISWLLLVFGLVFELPLIFFFLSKVGLVTAKSLSKSRRIAILLIFIISAILTPPDVISQIMLAVPFLVLYEISILVVKITSKKEKDRQEESANASKEN